NHFRRNATPLLTNQIGKNAVSQNMQELDPLEVKRVLVSRPNHRLGNQLLITPLVQELRAVFPNSGIDLFLKGGIAPVLFKNHKGVTNYFLLPKNHFGHFFQYLKCWLLLKRHRYDIVINVEPNSSSGRLSTQWARAKYKIFGIATEDLATQYPDVRHFAKRPIYMLRHSLGKLNFVPGKSMQVPHLDLILDAPEISSGRKILHEVAKNNEKTIGIYTYATGSKCYGK